MVALEDLVVGVEHELLRRVDEAFVEVSTRGVKHTSCSMSWKMVYSRSLCLALLRAIEVGVALGPLGVQVRAQCLEVLGEGRLGLGGKWER
ncbi:MAG: hypothetical protein R2810_01535 [Flavobacteriales bacterium]